MHTEKIKWVQYELSVHEDKTPFRSDKNYESMVVKLEGAIEDARGRVEEKRRLVEALAEEVIRMKRIFEKVVRKAEEVGRKRGGGGGAAGPGGGGAGGGGELAEVEVGHFFFLPRKSVQHPFGFPILITK